jgi:hypothetical protein
VNLNNHTRILRPDTPDQDDNYEILRFFLNRTESSTLGRDFNETQRDAGNEIGCNYGTLIHNAANL